jgi:hypothetical protein
VKRPISIPKTAALKTSAVTKVAVVAVVAVCWSTPDLLKKSRTCDENVEPKDIHGNERDARKGGMRLRRYRIFTTIRP